MLFFRRQAFVTSSRNKKWNFENSRTMIFTMDFYITAAVICYITGLINSNMTDIRLRTNLRRIVHNWLLCQINLCESDVTYRERTGTFICKKRFMRIRLPYNLICQKKKKKGNWYQQMIKKTIVLHQMSKITLIFITAILSEIRTNPSSTLSIALLQLQ